MEIALLTAEAKYIVLSQSMCDLLLTKALVLEIIEITQAITHSMFFEDNQGAISLAIAPRMMPQTKHIGLKYHFFHEHVARGMVKILYCKTADQVADIITKGLTMIKFNRLRKMLMGWW